ncbi:MAG: hypothetical protein CEE42_14590 [Promethearchaeota archaeon Loki_b31]|nr:MAG: hypothetical protein CEE42_14590 [Candidatus Lokiarchaeota archaeon Loki_b31]
MTDVDDIIKRVKMKVSHKKRNIIIVVVVLVVAIGQLIFLFSVQSRLIWRFDGVWSGSSPWGGELTFNVPPKPLFSNRYIIHISDTFVTVGEYEEGNITFFHLASNQSFFFEYFLGEGPFIGTESEEQIWNLHSGMYNITWSNSDSHPHYKLIAASFLYPLDELVVMVSGFVCLIALIALIRPIISIINKSTSVKKSPVS